ncbi:MAG: UvrB/UvrC motif-containing protein [Pirellulales bacterium]
MSKDISHIIRDWDYEPDKMSVRLVAGDDDRELIQVRLELGVLQLEIEGRPDGRKIDGEQSWLDFFEHTQQMHDAANPDGTPFMLEPEDCERLLREGIQYYHRYTSFWHLKRYELCARDTNRNLRLFRFVKAHARRDRDKLQFDQWRPYVIMMHTKAVATPLLQLQDVAAAVGAIDAGITAIGQFLSEYQQEHRAADCVELVQLERWRKELNDDQQGAPPHAEASEQTPLERLQEALRLAVAEERFEDAARLRDDLHEWTEQQSEPREDREDENR